MRKFLLIILALGGVALLKTRADKLGSWSAAAESLKSDLVAAVADRGKPERLSLWQRIFGSKQAEG